MKLEKEFTNLMRDAFRGAGAVYVQKNHGSRFVTTGRPDLEIIQPNTGRMIGLEMKRTKAELMNPLPGKGITAIQMENLWTLAKSGGIALAACLEEKPFRERGRKLYEVRYVDVTAAFHDGAWRAMNKSDLATFVPAGLVRDPHIDQLKIHVVTHHAHIHTDLGDFARVMLNRPRQYP